MTRTTKAPAAITSKRALRAAKNCTDGGAGAEHLSPSHKQTPAPAVALKKRRRSAKLPAPYDGPPITTADSKAAAAILSATRQDSASTASTKRVSAHSDIANAEIGRPAPAALPPSPQTKAAQLEALLRHDGGASLAALCDATGWQAHSCRAFLTGLRKAGKVVTRIKDEAGQSIYAIAAAAAQTPQAHTAPSNAETRG
jgi:hypothetical protein